MSTKIMPCSQDYNILCGVLERNGILYEVKSDHSVACIVCAGGGDIRMTFSVDTSKMLVTLFAPVITGVPAETATDMALAVCMINDRIPEGAFCFDVTAGNAVFEGERLLHLLHVRDAGGFPGLIREVREFEALAGGFADQATDHVVGVAERHAGFDQKIGEVGSQQRRQHLRMHLVEIEAGAFQSFLHHAENHLHVMDGVENRFLVFLQVAAVAERGSLHQRVEGAEVSEHAAGLSADEFHGVGVLLLRHRNR